MDLEFYKALNTPNKEFYGQANGLTIPYQEYSKILHSCDVALLPLTDTPINRMKSDLKFIEAAGHGAVALASPTVYSETIRHDSTGFIYHTDQEFVDLLCLLIQNRTRRIEIAETAYNYVKNKRLLCDHYQERYRAYMNLYARLPKLNAEVEQRMQQFKLGKMPAWQTLESNPFKYKLLS